MKILILLDGSKFSEAILGPAKTLASQGGDNVEVHLVQVLDPGTAHTTWMRRPPSSVDAPGPWAPVGSQYPPSDVSYGVALETKDQALDRRHDEVMDYLRHVSASHFDEMARIEVLFHKDVAEGIVKYAKAEKVDFIAIATHGRTGLSKVLLGSVAAGLLRANVAPLYMVRPDDLNEEAE
ncbi:MAG: universal stress protein [Dehalococcoidia bacterium]